MVVDDLDTFRSGIGPRKADSELVVDPKTMLPSAVTAQTLKPIPRRMA